MSSLMADRVYFGYPCRNDPKSPAFEAISRLDHALTAIKLFIRTRL